MSNVNAIQADTCQNIMTHANVISTHCDNLLELSEKCSRTAFETEKHAKDTRDTISSASADAQQLSDAMRDTVEVIETISKTIKDMEQTSATIKQSLSDQSGAIIEITTKTANAHQSASQTTELTKQSGEIAAETDNAVQDIRSTATSISDTAQALQ